MAWKVVVDFDLCESNAVCMAVAPEVFEVRDDDFDADARWYVGRPLLVTQNDYELRLYNGDTGVVGASTRS